MTGKIFTHVTLSLLLLITNVAISACSGGGTTIPAISSFPTVTSTTPVGGSFGVTLNSVISATFSEAMDPATITSATFTLTSTGGIPVTGNVTATGTTVSFTPAAPLTLNNFYTATITTGAKTATGKSLANDFSWSFSTGTSVQPGSAPQVILTFPAANSTGVPVTTSISATFNTAMDATTITSSTFMVSSTAGTISGAVSLSGTTATFKPTTQLAPNTIYTATITRGAKDATGTPLASDFTWTFTTTGTTGGTSPPTVTSTVPADTSKDIAVDAAISATFSTAMDSTTISGATFLVSGGTGAVSGVVTLSGTTATFNPSALLSTNTIYTATITTGARDLSGNPLGSNFTWSFTTRASVSPTVLSTSPANGATGVSLTNPSIAATFSRAMNPGTITALTFTLSFGGVPVTGNISHDSTGATFTFTPNAPLQANTTYTAAVTTGAQDPTGIPLASNVSWSFTTVP